MICKFILLLIYSIEFNLLDYPCHIHGMSNYFFYCIRVFFVSSFNQLLLPPYPTRDILKKKLLLAIENCEGFGIE